MQSKLLHVFFDFVDYQVKEMGYGNFDRQYRLTAGPSGQTGFEIGAGNNPLKIEFSLQKADLTSANTGKVSVWNLNPEHLAILNRSNCALSLRAGYGNRISLIFAGKVSFASTTIDSADRKTEIEVVDNLITIRNTFVSVNYKGNIGWKTIIDDVAAQIGAVVVYSYNATFGNLSNGFSFVGLAKDVLTKACNSCGLSWSIQNGILQIHKSGDTMSRQVHLISVETGMLGIPERVVVEKDDDAGTNLMGWDVEYFLNGAININDYVKLESKTVSGYFRVYSLEHSGDNVSGDWISKARLVEAT